MTSRHRMILLLTSAFGALVLFCPVSGNSPMANLGPIVSTAPPLFTPSPETGSDDSSVMNALRREAGLALGQLRARGPQ